MRPRRLLTVLALAALSTLAASSCLSPTLPLPPPEVPSSITAGADPGTWDVSGDCDYGALVTVFNETTGRGVVVEDRARVGVYRVTLEGAKCDAAWVRQEVGGEESTSQTFVLAPYDASAPPGAPACP